MYNEIVEHLSDNRGVIITGAPGSGKTTIMLQIVGNSCFGPGQSLQDRNTVGSQVVAYHFCQVDNDVTCKVGEMVHSIAAQLSQSPCLTAYHQLLSMDHNLRAKLSMPVCTADPDTALTQAILAPLSSLRKSGKISADSCIILIDALCDSQLHCPDYGDTIITFLAKHLPSFPPWLKLVCTVRTDKKHLTKDFSFKHIRYLSSLLGLGFSHSFSFSAWTVFRLTRGLMLTTMTMSVSALPRARTFSGISLPHLQDRAIRILKLSSKTILYQQPKDVFCI